MKKSTITLICFLLGLLNTFSQDYNIQPKQGLELQFGANAIVVNLKYQRYFWLNSQQHVTVSAGAGLFYGTNFSQDLTYSIGNGRNFWEIGILGTCSNVSIYEFRRNYQFLVLPMTGYKYISPIMGFCKNSLLSFYI